jgi:single-strand DNA-binding protein
MLNRVTLIGHVGQDPEIRDVDAKHQVVHLSLATTYGYRDGGGQRQEATDWHRVVAWDRDAANLVKFVHRGDLLLVEGRLDYGVWKDRRTGQDRREASVRLTSWRKLRSAGSRQEAEASGEDLREEEGPAGEAGLPAGEAAVQA